MKSRFISNLTSEVKIVCLIEMSSWCNVAVSKGEGVMHRLTLSWPTSLFCITENGPWQFTNWGQLFKSKDGENSQTKTLFQSIVLSAFVDYIYVLDCL